MDIDMKEDSGEQQSYVVAGAVLRCSCGTMMNRLKMPLSHGVYIKGKAQMNIMDYQPQLNIAPFGMCATIQNPAVDAATKANNNILTMMPCTPIVSMPWANGKEDQLVDGQPALMNKCTATCQYKGIITIEDDGQDM
ncbi:DUF4280 domain-containing protein [Paenibacillus turpanensis]|uniref:DUF4280 domain-containing protein n=1 Tax=Paenibacillus turpanensis TaxID=2689078 RepID=UPI00140BD0E7|nr:DUF4280 domain-containing protein [Paenibacillus turpanensis]